MPKLRRGVCPTCRRYVAVTWATGLVRLHGPAGNRCKGVGQIPLGEDG